MCFFRFQLRKPSWTRLGSVISLGVVDVVEKTVGHDSTERPEARSLEPATWAYGLGCPCDDTSCFDPFVQPNKTETNLFL